MFSGRARVRIPIEYRNREVEVRIEIPGFSVKTIKITPGARAVIEI